VHQEVLGKAHHQGRLGKHLLQHAEERRERCDFFEYPMETDLVKCVCEMERNVGTHSGQRAKDLSLDILDRSDVVVDA
jgi:hypothetical protein